MRLTPEEYEAAHPASECILWDGTLNAEGYGHMHSEDKKAYAHRVVYAEVHGPIPPGMVIDHLCRSKNCINVEHMQAVTIKENTLRGNSPAARQARQTHCKRGHEFTPVNTYRHKDGRRECRECTRARRRK